MLLGLKTLIGRHVTAVNVRGPAYDLELDFGTRMLRVFCDQTADVPDESNYTIELWKLPLDGVWRGELYTVLARGQLTMEKVSGASTRLVAAQRGRSRKM
jgi:hypothetical protein